MKYKRKKNYWQRGIRKYEYARAVLIGIIAIILFSYLFYGTVLCAVLLSPYLVRYMKSWERQCIKKKKQVFQLQFKDAIQSLAAALNVGYSVENAMKETMKDLQMIYRGEEQIVREFRYMLRQLEINVPVEQVWKEFAERTEDEDVQTFVTVFVMAKRSGGDMIEIIRNAVRQMGEKTDVKREIETVISAKKLEFKVMTAIPFAMICYMKVSFPEFMMVLYGNVLGIVIMTVCLCTYIAAYEFGKWMVEIEV